jgi:transglutaminase-like putative cysteine protease
MRLTIRHTMTFSLGTPPRAVEHLLLTPLATPQQRVLRWNIEMPGFADAASFRDGFGNAAQLVTQLRPDGALTVIAGGTVETADKAGVLGRLDHDPVPALFHRQTAATRPDPTLIDGLSDKDGRIAMLHALMGRVHEAIGASGSAVTPAAGAGGSQAQSQSIQEAADTAEAVHRFLGAARAMEIPARYVTGYLVDGTHGRFHAWAEAWDGGLGWIGFDPLLDLCPADMHVRVASGLDAASTAPIRTAPVWAAMPAETVEIVEG